jgi:hypothetical protein
MQEIPKFDTPLEFNSNGTNMTTPSMIVGLETPYSLGHQIYF